MILINKKIKFSWDKNKKIEILRSIKNKIELRKKFKEFANPNCKTCYGIGHIGYKEKSINIKNGSIVKEKVYITCPKCIDA